MLYNLLDFKWSALYDCYFVHSPENYFEGIFDESAIFHGLLSVRDKELVSGWTLFLVHFECVRTSLLFSRDSNKHTFVYLCV